MNTVIYARKSRGTQEELQNQIDLCKDYCCKNNYKVSEVFAEIRSSQDFEREQYKALKKYIKENTNVRVVVTHADRLNRNVVQQAKLNELLLKTSSYIEVVGSGIIMLDTPEQQMLSNIINSFNEYNYKLIRHKMVTGLNNFKKRGGKVGATPIGFIRVDKFTYRLDPKKSDIIHQIFKDISGGLSTKEIVSKLEKIDFKSNNNKKMGTREIRNIVKNKVYYTNNPPIVSKELWLLANQQLKSLVNRGGKRSYSLSNKIICSKCHTSLIIGYKNDRGLPIINSCNSSNSIRGNSSKCNCMGSRLDIVENLVISDSLAYLESKLAELYHQLKDDKTILAEHQKELDTVQAEIDINKEKLSKLNKLFLLDNISEQELQEYSTECKDNIALLSEKQKRLEGYSLFKVVHELQDKIVALEEMKSNSDINELVQLVDHVDYYKSNGGLEVRTIFRE